jgi:hypothetical protein
MSWINTQEYTPFELFLFIGGCSLWVLVYLIWARNIVRKKYFELPIFASCADIGWEFTWSFLATTNMGLFLEWTYRSWFLFDIFLFIGLLLYGWKQYIVPQLQPLKVHIPVCVLVTLFWVAAVYFMHVQGLDTPIGARSAYLDQLCISFLYIPLMLRQKSLENYSFAAAWLRMLGTGMNTVFMNIHYPDDYFLRLIATVSTVLDCTYIYLFWMRRRQLRQAVAA